MDRARRCLAAYGDHDLIRWLNQIGRLLTLHDHVHIAHKTIDHLQDVSLRHAGFILREPVKSPEYTFNLVVSQQLLRELFWAEFSSVNL